MLSTFENIVQLLVWYPAQAVQQHEAAKEVANLHKLNQAYAC